MRNDWELAAFAWHTALQSLLVSQCTARRRRADAARRHGKVAVHAVARHCHRRAIIAHRLALAPSQQLRASVRGRSRYLLHIQTGVQVYMCTTLAGRHILGTLYVLCLSEDMM